MEPAPMLLEAHRAAHPPGSRRAVVGPVPIPQDPGEPPIVEYRRLGTEALLDRLATAGYRLGFRDVYTGNLSVRTDVLREVGAFDATFTLYGHEDYEIGLRLAQAGVELAYCPEAVAYQRYEKDFPAMARDCIARGQTAVLFARKHPEAASGLRLASYDEAPRRWRLLRSVLLALSAVLPRLPEQVMRLVTRLERRRGRRLHSWYTLAVDYFFWLGARAALEAERPPPTGLAGVPLPMRIGFVLMVLFALASSGRLLVRVIRSPAVVVSSDEITRTDRRFQPLRQVVRPGERLGYLGHPPADLLPGGDDPGRIAFRRLVLAQYALLPAIMGPGIDAERVVVDFDSAAPIDPSAVPGLTPVQDFGDGVMLFRASRE
jgi:hypothetical protein